MAKYFNTASSCSLSKRSFFFKNLPKHFYFDISKSILNQTHHTKTFITTLLSLAVSLSLSSQTVTARQTDRRRNWNIFSHAAQTKQKFVYLIRNVRGSEWQLERQLTQWSIIITVKLRNTIEPDPILRRWHDRSTRRRQPNANAASPDNNHHHSFWLPANYSLLVDHSFFFLDNKR